MTRELEELYQEVILDHNKNPRNFRELPEATTSSHGHNPLCGDDYQLYLLLDEAEIIQDIAFQGSGCAISKASASMMTATLKKKTVAEAGELFHKFTALLTQDAISAETRNAVGKLSIFEGVKKFPVRVKCAMLSWRTFEDAVQRQRGQRPLSQVVSTEGDADPMNAQTKGRMP